MKNGAQDHNTLILNLVCMTLSLDLDGVANNHDDLVKDTFFPLSCLLGLTNPSMNIPVVMILSPLSAFSTFPDPRTSCPNPILLTSLPSTLPMSTSITSFRRSSSKAMSPSLTAKASSALSYKYPNSECMQLLQNQPGELIHIMDDQTHCAPKKTTHMMVEAFGKTLGKSLVIQGQLSRLLRLPNIHYQSLQQSHHLLI